MKGSFESRIANFELKATHCAALANWLVPGATPAAFAGAPDRCTAANAAAVAPNRSVTVPVAFAFQFEIRNSKFANARAFTLLEVMLAITLIVGLMTCLYGFYDSVLATRADLARQRKTDFAQCRLLDLVANDLQSARFFPLMGQCLQGDSQQVTFFRAGVPSVAVFYPPPMLVDSPGGLDATSQPTATSSPSAAPLLAWEPEHDVQQISYRLGHGVDDAGADIITGMERTSLRTIAAEKAEEGVNIQVDPLSDQVKFLRLQYWDGQAWQDTWSANYLPVAVKVTLGLEELPAELALDEYPYATVWREVAIPCGGAP